MVNALGIRIFVNGRLMDCVKLPSDICKSIQRAVKREPEIVSASLVKKNGSYSVLSYTIEREEEEVATSGIPE